MPLKIATWNINSVRLRQGLVLDLIDQHAPDVICLQEIKCRDEEFPSSAFEKSGYRHIAIHGQKAYHGVATVSRLPIREVTRRAFCGKDDARHIETVVDAPGGPVTLSNFYIPAGGDIPDPDENEKFAHKLAFMKEFHAWGESVQGEARRIAVGDFNIAPLENDVWSHKQLLKVVSHTPIETEALNAAQEKGRWHDVVRQSVPETEKLYTWWSYRARDWSAADKGRRLDHIWTDASLAEACSDISVVRDARGWEKPSDHAPVMAVFDL